MDASQLTVTLQQANSLSPRPMTVCSFIANKRKNDHAFPMISYQYSKLYDILTKTPLDIPTDLLSNENGQR